MSDLRLYRPVPEISRFFGIVIRMFVEAGGSVIGKLCRRAAVGFAA